MVIPSILEQAHALAADRHRRDLLAVGAPVGLGHATAFRARAVGAGGAVVISDVQEEALVETRHRLEREALSAPVRLVHAGHQTLARHLEEAERGRVGAIMFNLGYLPGGDHSVVTRPETTRQALDAGTEALRPGGVITVVAYTGHEGGDEEADAVEAWASALPQAQFRALSYRFPNWSNDPPRLFAVEKRDA